MESYIKKHKSSKSIPIIERKIFVDIDKKTCFFLVSLLLSLLSFQDSKLFLISAILSIGYLLDISYLIIAILSGIIGGIILGPSYFLFFSSTLICFFFLCFITKKIKVNLAIKIGLIGFVSDFFSRCVFLYINSKTFDYKVFIASLLVLFIYNLGVNCSSLLKHQKLGKIKQTEVLSTCLLIILSIGGVLEILDNPLIGYIFLALVFLFISQVLNISLLSYSLVASSFTMYFLFNFSLEQISLFIAPIVVIGLLNINKKYSVVFTYIASYVFILLFQGRNIFNYTLYLIPLLASLIYICVPSFLIDDIKKHVFNVETFEEENIRHVKKLEIEVANKLDNIAKLFDEISKEYKSDDSHRLLRKQASTLFYNLCINCPKNKKCYQTNETDNLSIFLKSVSSELTNDDIENISNNCMKPGRFLELSSNYKNEFYREYNYNEQYKQLKKVLAYQVLGFKEMLEQYSNKIKIENLPFINSQEEQIKNIILSMNIDLIYLDTYKENNDKLTIILDIKIENIEQEQNKIVENLAQGINKSLKITSIKEMALDNYYSLVIEEYSPYEFIFGINQKSKNAEINGDSYLTFNDEYSHIYAISDGMGAGKEAKEESSTTLKLLKNIISCGGDIKYSVMMINSLLKAKNRYDTYATLDLLMIDNKTLKATFSKNGSPCSYVYRNNELIKIDSASLPIGIIENIKTFDYEVDLKEDDIVIMFSDGIDDNQVKIKDVINACYFEHPQQIAKKLVDNLRDDKVNDDTSVMIIKIKKKV